MKKLTLKPTRTRATRPASSHTDATASAPPQPAPAPAASAPPPPAPTAPARRKLPGNVLGLDGERSLRGNIKHFGAGFQAHTNAVAVVFELENHRMIRLVCDHVHTRATVATLRHALSEFLRFHRGRHAEAFADTSTLPQAYCHHRPNDVGEDEEVRCEFLPRRDWIRLTVCFSEGAKSYWALMHFTRAEAEALLHDLEHALSDLEHYGDAGV